MEHNAGSKQNEVPINGFLGSAAYMDVNHILSALGRQEINFMGTGASVNYVIRRPYPFVLAVVNNTNSTTATIPTANSDGTYNADSNYTLVHNAPVGTILTVAITPVFPII